MNGLRSWWRGSQVFDWPSVIPLATAAPRKQHLLEPTGYTIVVSNATKKAKMQKMAGAEKTVPSHLWFQ